MTVIEFPTKFFVHVVDIDTDVRTGTTLKKMKMWLAENGYAEKEDYRHCGTKQRIVNLDIESGSGFVTSVVRRQYNRFRFCREEDET